VTPREQLDAGAAAIVRLPGSQLPAPIVSVAYRIERRRMGFVSFWKRDVRVEVFRLEERYVYREPDFSLHIPKGFEFEASVPRLVFPAISPLDLGAASPLVHDFLYRCGGQPPLGTVAPIGKVFTRLEADQLFRWMMQMEGVEKEKREGAYQAVRRCGARAWRGPHG
jgi:hypothetical protein